MGRSLAGLVGVPSVEETEAGGEEIRLLIISLSVVT